MTKVWIVSGFVLIGTGLSLAVFGAWLSGNANCDAGDLGRSCIAASLGVAVVGAALSLAGWMRVRRTQGADASDEGAAGLLARRPGLALLAFSIVGILLLTVLLPGPQPPASIYGGPAIPLDTDPAAFVPDMLAGIARTDVTAATEESRLVAEAGYEGSIFVRVTRFNASANWTPPPSNWNSETNQPHWDFANHSSVENATAAADGYLAGRYSALGAGGTRLCVRQGPNLWFASDAPDKSIIAWRDGTFVFEVTAPASAVRNAVAAAVASAA